MKKVIAGTCLFMILLVGCGGKNNNQVSNEERNANIPEVIKNSYTQIDNNIYDISKLFAVENNNIIRYKVFFDAGMIVIENKNSGYEIYPINFEGAEFSQENVCKIGRVNSIWQCDKGIATDVLIESRDYYDNTYERSVYELQEDGSIKKSVLGTYDVNEKKNISNTNNYESKYLYYYLCDDEKQIRKYNIETGQDEIIAEMNTLNISVINNIVHGESGYSFNGNGLAENTGKGQQTHGLYGQIDNQGNIKEIIFDYNSSEVFTYNGGLIIKNVINPLENPITVNEVRSLCSVNLENEVLNMEDNKWIMKYTSVVSENGKYILFSDLNNIKDKDTTTFIIYDIKENKFIYKKDIQKHKNAVIQNINISEKYNGFIYSYFEEGIRKTYFYKF
ncbi:MAG: hypothetical protein PUD13_02935 [Lachnospira sp.]|nr:hypothetical protein [Lachnospira sp.]